METLRKDLHSEMDEYRLTKKKKICALVGSQSYKLPLKQSYCYLTKKKLTDRVLHTRPLQNEAYALRSYVDVDIVISSGL